MIRMSITIYKLQVLQRVCKLQKKKTLTNIPEKSPFSTFEKKRNKVILLIAHKKIVFTRKFEKDGTHNSIPVR